MPVRTLIRPDRRAVVSLLLAWSALALGAGRATAQAADADSLSAAPLTPEPVLGIAMGTNRRGLREYLAGHGWTTIADSVSGVGNPSVHAGTLAGRPAEIIGMFGESGRLVNLLMNVPATSEKDLGAAYVAMYRLLEHSRCAPTLPSDYVAQRDSILRGTAAPLSREPSGRVYAPILTGHTTLTMEENTDWPRPTWANRDALIGTRLSAVRLGHDSRWPYQVTVWSASLLMLEGPTMCADSRAALDAEIRTMRRKELASLPARAADALDSIIVVAGPGAIIRVDTLVVRGTEREPEGVKRVLKRARGSRLHYDVHADAGYDAVDVMALDSIAPATGTLVVDGESLLAAAGRAKPRPETKRLYDLMRAELMAKNPLAAFVAVECEMERLRKAYPETADQWIAQVNERAHDPAKDGKAVRRVEDALDGQEFGGCAYDRKHYGIAP